MNPAILQIKRNRNRYHTNIKIAAKLDILPACTKQTIPKSTFSGFRNTDYSTVFGIDGADSFAERIELARKIVKSERILKIYRAYNRIKNTLLSIHSSLKNIKPHLKKFKEKIVNTIDRVKNTIALDRACRFFGISVSRFHSWLYQT